MTRALAMLDNTSEIKVYNAIDESLVTRWIAFIDVRQQSRKTYGKAMKQFFKYIHTNQIAQPTRDDVINFRDELLESRKPSTVQLYLTAVKMFFRWLSVENIYPNVADHIKGAKIDRGHKKDALSAVQSSNLLKSIDTDNINGLRDRAIIALCLTAGLRTIEIVRANVGDLQVINGKTYLFVQGKGHDEKTDCVLVSPAVEKAIRDYLNARGKVNDNQPLFASLSHRNYGGRLTTQSVSRIAKNNLRAAGLDSKRITAHSLRHTAATIMLLNGAQLAQVQQVLRHSSINTTMIYAHAIERMKNDSEQLVSDAIGI